MKPYVAFSRAVGAEEGAILVIAHTSREAKKLAWQSGDCWNIDGWTDLAIKLIRDCNLMPLADQEKIKRDIAHVVNQPAECENCHLWGAGLDCDGGMCSRCGEPPGERLIKAIAESEEPNDPILSE